MHKPAIQMKKKQQTDPYFAAIRTLPKHHVKTLSAWRQGSQPLKVEEKQIATLLLFLGGFSPPIDAFSILNPLTLMSDQDRISPYSIKTLSTIYVMRIKKNINLRIISWSNTKFPEPTL